MQNRVFRLFVSSTFEDFAAERERLRQHVFPEVEALCRDIGAKFEAVDLRWGISAEAASAQDTMAICLQELDRCLATGLRPSLLILLGDRYGWCPLPDEIHPHDFDKIVHRVRKRCGIRPLALLKRHYPLDKNTRDPVHRLRVFGANQNKSARFEKIENKIRSVLRFGADALSPQRRRRLMASATEREIARGLLERRGLARHALCCIRSLRGIRREELGRPWIDLDDEGNVDCEAQARLTLLKRRIIARLGKAACSLHAHLVDDRVDENYLKRFCAAVRRHLISDISKQASAWGAHSPLDKEIEAHRQFGLSRAQTVVGRQKSLREIRRYLSHSQQAPLIVSGESGIGKSALIAAALKELDASNSRPIIIRRFIGATPQSSQGQSLVSNLYSELARRLKTKPTRYDHGFLGLAHAFRSALVAGKTRRPVVISIDALDQFASGDEARELQWLPPRLPANRWLIVSAVQPSYCLRQLERKYPKAPAIQLKGLEVAAGEELLKLWLEEKGRHLQRHQSRPMRAGLTRCGSPLYLRLAASEASRLRSFDEPPKLGTTVTGVARAFFARLAQGRHHGQLFVERALAYIATSRYGLSHGEIRQALWVDPEVRQEYRSRHRRSPNTEAGVAPLVWARFFYEIADYLTLHETRGGELMTFFHDQIRRLVETRYLPRQQRTERHRSLARCFTPAKGKPYGPRAFTELPYQLSHAGEWKNAEKLFCDGDFVAGSVETLGSAALISDIDRTLELGRNDLEDAEPIESLRLALAQSSHIVDRSGSEIPAQLIGYLRGSAHRRARKLARDLRRLNAGIWLEPLSGSLTGSGLRRVMRPLENIPTNHGTDQDKVEERQPRIWDVHVCADGRTLLSASHDHSVRVWNAFTGQTLATLIGHRGQVQAVCATPDGQRAVSVASDGALIAWDLRTAEVISRARSRSSEAAVAITSGGTRAITGSINGHVRIWDIERGRCLRDLWQRGAHGRNKHLIWRIAISPDGGRVITVMQDGTLRLWSLRTGKCRVLARSALPGDLFRSVALDSAGRRCISGTGSGFIVSTDLHTGRSRSWLIHETVVRDLVLTTNGRQVVSVSQNGQLAISSFRCGRVSLRSQAHGDEVNTVALARDDRTLVTGASDGVVKIWDLPTLRRSVKQPRHLGRVVGIGVVNGGKQVISGGMDGFLCLWDAKTGKFQHRFGSRSRVIRQVKVTPDGHHVVFLSSVRSSSPEAASAFSDDRSRLHVLDLRSGQEWNTLTTTQEWDNRVAVSPVDGNIVAVTNETDVSFFSPHELKPTATMRNVAYHIYHILVAPDGSRVLVRGRGADDYTGNRNVVLNLRSGKPEASLRGSQAILAFRNARQLWVRGRRGKLHLWDLGIGKTVWTSAFPGGEPRAARVSEDGRRAIFLGADDAMIVWDLVHDKRLATLEGGGNEVEGVDFWPGKEFALTISRDDSLGVWDWRRARRLASFTASDRISCYTVLPEQRVVVMGDACGGVHFLRLEGIAA